MQKVRVLIKAPVLTQSGYGEHSREIFKALNSDPAFDVFVESLNWGQCSFLTRDSELKQQILECQKKFVLANHQKQTNWDLFVHVTIPNEFEQKGKINIGVTAGIEVDKASHVWIQKCNEMDLVIVPSEHSKKVLVDTIVDWQNKNTGETGILKLNKPVIVCPEGVDTSVFKGFRDGELPGGYADIYDKFGWDFEPTFNFLHIGQWGPGGFGEDRKNIGNLVRYFIEAFQGNKDVGLVLKLNMAKNTVADFETIKSRISQIKANFKPEDVPPIYLLHGNLSEEEMAALYNHPKIKSFISLTHGEGFGRPLLEAAACDLPILATNWSGHLDFLNKGKFSALKCNMVEIPESAVWDGVLIKGSKWAEVDADDVKNRMRKIVSAYTIPQGWAKDLGKKVREEYDLELVCSGFADVMKQLVQSSSSSAQVNPVEHLRAFVDTPEDYNVVYTMPMSTGDVFISTAVIDGLMKEVKEKQPNAKLYFATQDKYKDVLKNNPNVHKIIPWNQTMMSIELLEEVFDLALTPDTTTHYQFSNWIRGGEGRLLAEEYANHCHSELGEYFIEKDYESLRSPELMGELLYRDGDPEGNYGPYVTLHTTSGKGQWEGRRYEDWSEIILNLKECYPALKVAQVGMTDEDLVEGVDFDLRGKTTHQQLAAVLDKSLLHLSPDTFSMHLASALDTPLVALFGCSYAASTGPWVSEEKRPNSKYILMQSDRLSGCKDRPCYKNRCKVNPDGNGPINEIDAFEVFQACFKLLNEYEEQDETQKE